METAQTLSKTARRLSNEELGRIQKRTNELVRRIEEGTLELDWVMEQMQRVVEGKKTPEKVYLSTARPLEFMRPPKNERRRTRAPVRTRLPEWKQRLEYRERTPEHVMAEMWEAENIPHARYNFGRVPVNTILDEARPSKRDLEVMASTLQWLGCPIGKEFLARFVRVSQIML